MNRPRRPDLATEANTVSRFILALPSPQRSSAVDVYSRLQTKNGGDVLVSRKLGLLLWQAGFSDISMSARYECYSSLPFIGESGITARAGG
jgi:hypothetical protein